MLLLKLIVHSIFYESLSDFLVDFMMYSGVLQSNICFANCRKDPFFIWKLVGNQRQNDLKTIKISWNRLQIRSKIVQGTFWRPSGAPWGAQGVPDWILGVKSWFVGPPLDPRWGPFFDFVSMQNSSNFGFDFWMHFWAIGHPFWRPICIPNGPKWSQNGPNRKQKWT